MSSERPAKRVRQACEPCRRKKTKCPGEKPACSHCARLRQQCSYADEIRGVEDGFTQVASTPVRNSGPAHATASATSDSRLEQRVKILEAQLSDVVSGRVPVLRENSSPSRSRRSSPQPSVTQIFISSENSDLLSWETIEGAGRAYLTYCDSQPLPLFHRQSFLETLSRRDRELLFAILALALRFTEHETLKRRIGDYVETSRKTVSKKIFDGAVELSTLQCLCLLSLVDFTDGNTRRASVQSSLAMTLAHAAGLTSDPTSAMTSVETEERRRCFWSLYLLKRLHGADFSILDFTGEETFPNYPVTPDRPLDGDERIQTKDSGDENGITAYAIQLSQVWFKITKYARRRGKPSPHPPWSPQSEYSIILAEQMDFETRMPYTHRFRPARFSHRPLTELDANRDYWGPWMFLQIVYHTSILLLNHPLLLSLRLRNFKSMIPEIFLQHTSDMIASHASWVIHLIEMVERKSFIVTDPFLAYCVAIVATIYLQESFADDPDVRKQKKDNFHKCLSFIHLFDDQWPHVSRIARKLSSLSETVSASYPSTTAPSTHRPASSRQPSPPKSTNPHPTRSLLINLSLFWEILEYPAASELPASARHLFGPSLFSTSRGRRGTSLSEIAQTSPLPEPTRVEGQDFVSADADQASPEWSEGLGEVGQQNGGTRLEFPNVIGVDPGIGLGGGGGTYVEVPFVYTDEELAVLADSFFNQRGDDNGAVNNDWWNSGNL